MATSTARMRSSARAQIPSGVADTFSPISPSFDATISTCSSRAPTIVISPPAIPHAMSNVPVSMRSPMSSQSTGTRSLDAHDLDGRCARADHLRAHAVQHRRELDDLGLARRVLDHGGALGEHRGRQQVLGGAVAREVEHDARAGELLRARFDEPVHDVDLDPHRGETAEVHVERTAADVVATRHRDARLAEASYQRAEHVHRRAHERDELVRSLRPQRTGGVDLHLMRARSTRHRRPCPAARRS